MVYITFVIVGFSTRTAQVELLFWAFTCCALLDILVSRRLDKKGQSSRWG
jgi:hypothetical protein